MLFVLIAVKPDPLRLSANQKRELFDFIKNTKNKEEYRRAVAVKHKMEGMSYRTIAKNLGVNYRNVYYMIKYKKPKLALEHEKDYEEKKKTIDNYKKVSAALLKKDTTWV
jgi:transposase